MGCNGNNGFDWETMGFIVEMMGYNGGIWEIINNIWDLIQCT
jgi:hypothetical protein